MLNLIFVCVFLLPWGLFAQSAPGQLKGYRTNEEYCADNPNMPTCIKGKPLNLESLKVSPMSKGVVMQPKPRRVEPVRSTRTPAPRPAAIVKPAMIKLGQPDWRFAHPNADMMGGIRMRGMMQSAFGQAFLAQMAGALQLRDSDISKVNGSMAGLDEICFSKKGDDMLILMTGDVNKLEQQMSHGPPGVRLQVISLDQALMGKEAALLASARRLSVDAAESVAVQRARKLAASNDIWIIGSARSFAGAGARASSELSDFSLTLNMRDKLQIEAVLNTISPASAERILVGMKAGKFPTELAPTIDVQGTAVRLSLDVTQEQLAEGLKKVSADPRLTGLAVALRQGGKAAPAATPERTDGKVRIIGLPDGPREVELKK